MRVIVSFLCFAFCIQTVTAQRVITYVCADVPLPIPDGPAGHVDSHLPISDYHLITDINVVLTVTHTFDQDLWIYLIAPNEDIVRLVFGCGQSGDNYVNTRLDDEASMAICAGTPPFTGSFRPDQPLYEFDQRRNHGTWILRVNDDWSGDTGTLQSWSLEMTIDTTVAADDLPVIQSFSVGQNYPNPFNATTVLPIEFSSPMQVRLTIHSIDGRTVQDRVQHFPAGRHSLSIEGGEWSSGSYLAEIVAGHNRQTVRMLLLK